MIGIDGGGTKTEFVLFSENGQVLKRLFLSSSHPDSVGLEQTLNIFYSGIDELLEFSPNACAAFIGMAGVSNKKSTRASQILNELQKKYKNIKFAVESDILNVIYSVSKNKNMLALICGTGSILYMRKDGQNYRFGGWGNIFDDVGSGYAFGRDAIRAALLELDGVGEATVLSEYIREVSGDEVNGKVIGECYRQPKSYAASYAPLVFRAIKEKDDKVAKEILLKNAQDVAKLMNAAVARHGRVEDVVACGGVFKNREIFEPAIKKYLDYPINFVYPTLPPIYGACVGCCNEMNIDTDENFRQVFDETYNAILKGETK
jgi:N-acetylglucosamine kinase-like BadF-type ATPase